jgi:broad specificity phosphatase PhoE
MDHGHGGIDPKRAGFVRGRGHDTPSSCTAHDDGAPTQIRALPAFDLNEKGIHVNVQDEFGELWNLHSVKVAENGSPTFLQSSSMVNQVHLIRHGEVENPDHIVYADLQEFRLSRNGEAQAGEAASFLAERPITAVFSSPLTRAIQTALAIAAPHGIGVEIIDDLIEFGLSVRWRGRRWEELEDHFPGEVAAYLEHPWDLPFSPESLEEMADRMEAAIVNQRLAHPDGELVVVSHQDPVQAARLSLTGRSFFSFWSDKPSHAEVITLEPGHPWRETATWAPATESGPFPPPTGSAS